MVGVERGMNSEDNLTYRVSKRESFSSLGSPSESSSPGSSILSPSEGVPSPYDRSSEESPAASKPELSPELTKAGWIVVFSNKQHRYYFSNVHNHKSVWSLNDLRQPGDADRGVVQKRKSVEPPVTPAKKPNFIGSTQYNFSVKSNVKMFERVFGDYFPPMPQTEVKRAAVVKKVRQQMQDVCRRLSVNLVPHHNLMRWISHLRSQHKGREHLVPMGNLDDEDKDWLIRELLSDFPIKLTPPQTIPEAKIQLTKYITEAKQIADGYNLPVEQRKLIKWRTDETMKFVRERSKGSPLEEFMERLSCYREEIEQYLRDAVKPSYELACAKLCNSLKEITSQLDIEIEQELEQFGITILSEPLPAPKPRVNFCYPVILRHASPLMPATKYDQDNRVMKITCQNDTVIVCSSTFFKLESLYKSSAFDDANFQQYIARVWCLLKRYEAEMSLSLPFSTSSTDLSVGMMQDYFNAVLPTPVFHALTVEFHVTFECFASPLNCHYPQFCSPFPDTDGFFGSRGSFLQFFPVEGSLQVHPPHDDNIISLAASHVQELLTNSDKSLSFVVFLPEMGSTRGLSIVEGSGFKRGQITVPQTEVSFLHHCLHFPRYEMATCPPDSDMIIVVMQNDAGALRWPCTEEKLRRLRASFSVPLGSPMPPVSKEHW